MSTKYSSDDSKDTNYVRKMAKHFDTIYADSTTYTNTMQANWWLNTSAFGPYCDDTPSDTDTEHEPFNECTSQMANHTNDHEYGIEVAKIAYDHQTYNATANQRDKRDSKKPSFYDKIDFLRFPNRPHAQPLTYDHPAGFNAYESIQNVEDVTDRSSAEHIYEEIRVAGKSELGTRPASLTSMTSQTSGNSFCSIPSADSFASACSSATSSASLSTDQVFNILKELIGNEESYIRSLNEGISGYMNNFDQIDMPSSLRGQKYRVFGNIERIKEFHEKYFYPALAECNLDIVKICNTFCEFIDKDYFYIYVLYTINRQRSDKLYETNRDYFKGIQSQIGDRLGVNSFLVQPVQRLPKYKLLLGQLFKELRKMFGVDDDNKIKNELAACCLAEKRLQRLLDTVNQAMIVNDISDCNDLHTLCQGKFLLVDNFDIWEKNDLRRRYKGMVFLFERCIIYTEKIAKDKLMYRGHFWQTSVGFTFDDKRNSFGLYNERKGNRDIEFTTEAQKFQIWMQMLNQTMQAVYILEKRKVEKNRQSIRSNGSGVVQTLLRNCSPSISELNVPTPTRRRYTDSIFSISSSQSNSLWEFKDDSTSAETISLRSDHSTDSRTAKTTTWYTDIDSSNERKLVERFMNSEKFYIQLLKNTSAMYLTNLSDELRQRLDIFLPLFEQIQEYHATVFHPKLLECECDTVAICDLLKSTIVATDLKPYPIYSAYVTDAVSVIAEHVQAKENDSDEMCENVHEDVESLLVMPINHINAYAKFLDELVNEYKHRNVFTDKFKTIAAVEVEMKKIQKSVLDNYNLNAMKGGTCVAKEFGLVTYSDHIAIDFTKCILMVLERGITVIRTKISSKTNRDKLIEQIFCIPMTRIELHENDAYPRKIRISTENLTYVNHTISFTATRKKKQFMEAIRAQKNVSATTG